MALPLVRVRLLRYAQNDVTMEDTFITLIKSQKNENTTCLIKNKNKFCESDKSTIVIAFTYFVYYLLYNLYSYDDNLDSLRLQWELKMTTVA